ncbi:MAG: hypothetical protein ACRCVX_02375 [Shewanella sp.]
MDVNNITDFVLNLLYIITTVVGGASIVVTGLREIAKVTPTERDDIALAKVDRVLNQAAVWLDKLALNPPASKGRIEK